MIKCSQMRGLIIEPSLQQIGAYSRDIEEMLIAICAQETLGGTYLKQLNGPALGPFGMEPATHDSIWDTHLLGPETSGMSGMRTINSLGYKIIKTCMYTVRPMAETMTYNLWYATLMARAFWLDVHEEIPPYSDLNSIWIQYKKYWNTYKGKATQGEFFENYERYKSS